MEVFVLHILKLNIIAAIVILLVKLLARPLKNKVSARWKYFIWMFVVLSLLIPIRLPATVSIVDFKVKQSFTESSGQRKVQTTEFSDTAQPVNENIQNLAGVSIQKPSAIHENGKWAGIAAGIFLTVWLIVAILKMAGEFVAYYLSVKNLERMSLPVSDPVSIQIYRKACRNRHIRKAPELRQNAGLTTPLLAGLFRTRLYLPATGYSAEERKLVFYHELTHYYHKDLWYKMLLRIGASVYWFNPFLLLMLKEADEDIENLCDTAVVHSVNKKECSMYRQLLLRTVAMDNQVPYVTASLNDSGMVFRDRIMYMINIRKLRRGILPGILMAALLAGGNLAFNISSELTEAAVSAGTERTGQAEGNELRNENPMQQAEKNSELVDMQEITETQSGQDDTEVTAAENMSQNEENLTEKKLRKCHLHLTGKTMHRQRKIQPLKMIILPMVMAIIMSSCRTECHTPVVSVVLPELHQSWQLAKVIPNPEFFTITETELILMIMVSVTVIREMVPGQTPMEIPIVHGMIRIIIPESNWSSVSFRASMERWI